MIKIVAEREFRWTEELKPHGAVLLMDNCSSHTSDDVIALLTRERAKIIIFTPSPTRIFQMLEIVLFEALKKHVPGPTTLEEEQTIVALIIEVCHDFKQMMTQVNI
jgi:hypothetical protein